MFKKIQKSIILVLIVTVMFFSSIVTHALEPVSRKVKLMPFLDLVVSIYADDRGDHYANATKPKVFLDGVSGFELDSQDAEVTATLRGYKVAYRANVIGKTDIRLKGEFEKAGWKVSIEAGTKIHLYKYIEGVVYIEKPMKNICIGNVCAWSNQPVKEEK